MIYVTGSLRNPAVPQVAASLRSEGHEVWDDWFAAGEHADSAWQAYEQGRGRYYVEALSGDAAWHVFSFDYEHLAEADTVVLVMPAGRSAHLELGWAAGQGKRTYVLFDGEPERWDVMYAFCDGVYTDSKALVEGLRRTRGCTRRPERN